MEIKELLINKFDEMGGFSSKMFWLVIFFALWALWVFARENGCIRKKNVNGKHIFITGAGSGLGREMAMRFAKLGANVTISDINEPGLKVTQENIES